jgi:hypothetical protein
LSGYFASMPCHGSSSSCFMPSEMRWVSWLILMILTFTVWPMVKHFGRMIDPAPGDIGDVQQAVDAAEIDERTVIGDVLDHAVDHLTLFEVLHQLLALLGAGLFQNRAARHHDVAAAAIHLEDLERLRIVHQRRDVADRADIDLRARQEGHAPSRSTVKPPLT